MQANRALVTNDQPMQATAHERLSQGKAIPRFIGWPQEKYKRATVATVVQKFEQLAESDQPFNPDYPIIYL